MTDAGMTQDNFILPAVPVRGLPIFYDWLDTMKFVRNCTIPIILPSRMNILADIMFKLSIGNTNLDTRQIKITLDSRFCLFIIPNAMGTHKKIMFILAKVKKTHFRIAIPIKGCSSFIHCKAWQPESESVKLMYLDANRIFNMFQDFNGCPDFSSKYR